MVRGDDGNPPRRAFFREGLARLVGPVSEWIERRIDREQDATLLRPPGAIDERSFLDACTRCGECVRVCPANAIFPWDSGDEQTQDTPVIDPNRSACVVCDGLECMKACPSGALRLVAAPGLIRMGIAEVRGNLCVRIRGEDCRICVDHCPIGETALQFIGSGPPVVLDPGCVGCGVCQHDCPTTPKAIVVLRR